MEPIDFDNLIPIDTEDCVWKYRFASDTVRAAFLRKIWAEWQGEDSLHEMAWGEPIDIETLVARRFLLMARLDAKAELEWLSTIETAGPFPEYDLKT
jgi:hypothetical protein